MIKTPVSYDDSENVLYPYPQVEDANGSFIFECKDKQVAQEIVKRINMYDELINALSMMTDIASQVDGWESFPSYAIADAESVLGKCK